MSMGNAERVEGLSEGRRPNIIWVFPDQMRAQAMGCAGDPNVHTPNLDALAGRGVRFTNACSNYPVCVPARFTLLTGERASSRWVPTIHWRMSPAERTIAHELGEAGYATSYIGKWHLHGGDAPGLAYRRIPVPRRYRGGFERWQGFEFRNDPFDTYYFVDDDPEPHRIEGYQTDGLFDLALGELDGLAAGRHGADGRPFFLALSVEPPHPPYQGPRFHENSRAMGPDLVDRIEFRPNVDVERLAKEKPWLVRRWRRRQAELAPDEGAGAAAEFTDRQVLAAILMEYCQSVENVDANMGRLVEALERKGLWDDTIVVFFSDHGELVGSHGTQGKQLPYQESVGIPLIVAGGPIAGARSMNVVSTPVSIEDIFPTTVTLTGVKPAPHLPGVSLMPLLGTEPTDAPKGRDAADAGAVALTRDAVFLEYVEEHRDSHKSIPPWRAIRTERYCYSVIRDGPWMLFDLQDDPYEQSNLVDDPGAAGVRDELHERLMEHLSKTEDPFARMYRS